MIGHRFILYLHVPRFEKAILHFKANLRLQSNCKFTIDNNLEYKMNKKKKQIEEQIEESFSSTTWPAAWSSIRFASFIMADENAHRVYFVNGNNSGYNDRRDASSP